MTPDFPKIQKMRQGGKIIVEILRQLLAGVHPGITTKELDASADLLCRKHNVVPAFKGYQGYPAIICVGPNDVVVHGIPDDKPLVEGDILSVDFGIIYEGVYLDMARTIGVGKITAQAKKFINTTRDSLEKACKQAKLGNSIGDIGYAIQSTVEKEGYSVVREMVGHTIGYKLHEDPMIPGYGRKGEGKRLYEGQTVAIEAIINQGTPEINISKKDGWTARTNDGKLSALFENTVLVGKQPEILTPL